MLRASILSAMAVALAVSGAAQAQTTGSQPGGFLDNLFGGGDKRPPAATGRVAQADSDVAMRLDRLEEQIRHLTGSIEQLQYRNQQLEQTVRQLQGGGDFHTGDAGGRGGPAYGGSIARPDERTAQPSSPPSSYPQGSYPQSSYPQPRYSRQAYPTQSDPQPAAVTDIAASEPNGRGDAFDPRQHPGAPGTPRELGTLVEPPGGAPVETPVGLPGGRDAGAPLDLSNVSQPVPGGAMTAQPLHGPGGSLPPPPPRNTSATGAVASLTQPPTRTAKDQYDLAFGYMLHKDYAQAEGAFRSFLQHHPSDRLAPDATYWLGESLYQRQRYRDAAESFLSVTTKHSKSAKAPDSLFRLGQSLAALGEKEAACAALGEVGRKYPHASASVRQGVSREQKHVHC